MITYFQVGDWSDDGHGKTETVAVEHNAQSNQELYHAYEAGCDTLKIPSYYINDGVYMKDVMQHVANEYESSAVPEDIGEKFKELGWTQTEKQREDNWDNPEYAFQPVTEVNGTFYLDGDDTRESFVELWMRIAHLGRPGLAWNFVKMDVITPGGYGLFWS